MGSTDDEWRAWGERDPYFAVITDPAFRRANLDDAALAQFFASGEQHVQYLQATCRRHLDPRFRFGRALDFGCGVGRVVVPLAAVAESVVGVDVSQAMLDVARRHCDEAGLTNVELALSDDALSTVAGPFDFVHSFIVLQHIDVARGRTLFRRLLALLAPGGVAALQVTYARTMDADAFGKPVEPVKRPLRRLVRRAAVRLGLLPPAPQAVSPDPHMQMNCYSLDELLYLVQSLGAPAAHIDFTDHGGQLGVALFFSKPARSQSS
jgi:SAM-dependent methyltransferase